MTVIFYHPPPRANTCGLSRREVLRRIDYVGGLVSISGMLLFMMGLQWGGYNYPWASAHVLVPLLLGVVLIALFIVWERYFAKYPMFPGRVFTERRIITLTLAITAISGANFFSILLFWPTQSYNVYGHDPVGMSGVNVITLKDLADRKSQASASAPSRLALPSSAVPASSSPSSPSSKATSVN